MEAALFVATDKEGREHCVVVVKGTFRSDPQGTLTLAEKQKPLSFIDEHYGDPAKTSIRYACDFVLEKKLTDVIVVGKAVAPRGEPVKELPVRLEVDGRRKDLLVTGERRWLRVLRDLFPSKPATFTEMPITFDRAFGGQDESRGPGKAAAETRNLAGVGFNPHRAVGEIEGTALPNVESPSSRVSGPRDRVDPAGFGFIGPSSDERRKYAGTYDQRWLDNVAPFLPADFDSLFFQSAPTDQRFPLFRGGETIRCFNMAATQAVQYKIPALAVPVQFRFVDRNEQRDGVLDTVILEPHDGIAVLVWRCRVALGKKPNALQEIHVGPQPEAGDSERPIGYRNGKPMFRGLGAAVRWRRQMARRRR